MNLIDPIDAELDKEAQALKDALEGVKRPPETPEEALLLAVTVLRNTQEALQAKWPKADIAEYGESGVAWRAVRAQIAQEKEREAKLTQKIQELEVQWDEAKGNLKEGARLRKLIEPLEAARKTVRANIKDLGNEAGTYTGKRNRARNRYHYFRQLDRVVEQLLPYGPPPPREPSPPRPPPRLHVDTAWLSKGVQTLTKGNAGFTRALLAAFQQVPDAPPPADVETVLFTLLKEADAVCYKQENPEDEDDEFDPTEPLQERLKRVGKALISDLGKRKMFWNALVTAASVLPSEDPAPEGVAPPQPELRVPDNLQPGIWVEPRLRALLGDSGITDQVLDAIYTALQYSGVKDYRPTRADVQMLFDEIQRELFLTPPDYALGPGILYNSVPRDLWGTPLKDLTLWEAFLRAMQGEKVERAPRSRPKKAPVPEQPAVIPADEGPPVVWTEPRLRALLGTDQGTTERVRDAFEQARKQTKAKSTASAQEVFAAIQKGLLTETDNAPLDASTLYLRTPSIYKGIRERKFWVAFLDVLKGPVAAAPKSSSSSESGGGVDDQGWREGSSSDGGEFVPGGTPPMSPRAESESEPEPEVSESSSSSSEVDQSPWRHGYTMALAGGPQGVSANSLRVFREVIPPYAKYLVTQNWQKELMILLRELDDRLQELGLKNPRSEWTAEALAFGTPLSSRASEEENVAFWRAFIAALGLKEESEVEESSSSVEPVTPKKRAQPAPEDEDDNDLDKFRATTTVPAPPEPKPEPKKARPVIDLTGDDDQPAVPVVEERERKVSAGPSAADRAAAFLEQYGGVRALQMRAQSIMVVENPGDAPQSAEGAIMVFQRWLIGKWFQSKAKSHQDGPTLNQIAAAVKAGQLPNLITPAGISLWPLLFRNKLTQEAVPMACGACAAPDARYRCSHCREVRYCGQDCADAHWEEHADATSAADY